MDHSVLPEVFALSVLIFACRPLFGRLDRRVRFWFLGWSFVVLHLLVIFFTGVSIAGAGPLARWSAVATLELCGVCFVVASSEKRLRPLDKTFIAVVATPVMLQSFFLLAVPGSSGVFAGHSYYIPQLLAQAANLLLLLPLAYLGLKHRTRMRSLVPIACAFALLALCTLPMAAQHPELVSRGLLALLYLSAAYLYLLHAPRFNSGVVMAAVGLTTWALKFPFAPLLARHYPSLRPDHGLSNLPGYLVMGGIVLTLLEEYLARTERLAMHDPLTDLPNRRLFEKRFAEALDEARRERTTVACLVIDVDNFKTINDTFGHRVGDELLRALAVRLSWHMSPRDVLARTGGDEFTAMLAGVTDEHHLQFIAQAMMSAASVPVSVAGEPVDVHISMGVALSPDHADEIDELRHMADEAMYRAKRRGGDLLVFAGTPEPDAAATGTSRGLHHAPVLQMTNRQRRVSVG